MRTVKLVHSSVTVFQYSETSGAYIPVAEYGTENLDQLEALNETLENSEYVTVERHKVSRVGGIAFDRKTVDVIVTGDKYKVLKPRDM